ncbi:MAG: zinc-binding dehydrogenase, partial [Muribaculaceae bacterium]|nr:zinc-binding dehydrogenase [Muribaculaceae bacterium]
ITTDDTVLIIGAGPTGLCTLQCVRLFHPKHIVVCETDVERQQFVSNHYSDVVVVEPNDCKKIVNSLTENRGADRVIEVAGSDTTFEMAWQMARPNAIVTIVALYDRPQLLPLPNMYGKNITFKTGGVDAADCPEIMRLIADGKIDTTHLITHRTPLSSIKEAYTLFESKQNGVIKIAILPD